jgi:NitT/TauT family transport system substrate-binding protein
MGLQNREGRRKMNQFGKFLVTGCISTLALIAVWPTGALAEDKVSLRFGWSYGGMFAPIYLGVDKGFFKEQGIDVDLREGKGTVPSATSVGNGQDDFGFFDMSAAARLIDKGLPLKGIAQIRQKTTACVVVLEKSDIRKPKDLEGHSLSHTPGDSNSQIFPAFAKATGIDMKKVKQEGLDYSIYLKALESGQVDATLGYIDTEGFILENQGVKIRTLPFADYGIVLVDYGFATSLNMIKEKPDVVTRFIAAVVKSFTYATDHIDEAVQAGKKKFPEFDEALARKQVTFQTTLYGDSVKQGKPIGWIDDAVWKGTLTILHDYVGLQNTDTSKYYTNNFIPTSH